MKMRAISKNIGLRPPASNDQGPLLVDVFLRMVCKLIDASANPYLLFSNTV